MKHHKGKAKRNRGCGLCRPWRKAGNGGAKFDRTGQYANPKKHKVILIIDLD